MSLYEEIKKELININTLYKEDDWLQVKKMLLKSISPDMRKRFSVRHYYTKKHSLNKFEKEIINYYRDTFGISLELKENDKHTKDPIWKSRKIK